MSSRNPRLFPSLCLLALALTNVTNASAEEPTPSLYQKRLGIIQGTAKGIVLWGPDKSEPSAATPAAAAAPADRKKEAGVDGKPTAAAPQAPATSKFLSALPPPSGRSMAEAQRLGAVGGGIPIPTKAAPVPQTEPATKP